MVHICAVWSRRFPYILLLSLLYRLIWAAICIVRTFQGCLVHTETSVPRVTVCYQEALLTDSDPEGQIFLHVLKTYSFSCIAFDFQCLLIFFIDFKCSTIFNTQWSWHLPSCNLTPFVMPRWLRLSNRVTWHPQRIDRPHAPFFFFISYPWAGKEFLCWAKASNFLSGMEEIPITPILHGNAYFCTWSTCSSTGQFKGTG